MNSAIFRKYDIRGVVDTDLTDDLVHNLGRAIGTMATRAGRKTFAVGYDARLHSPRMQGALVKGLTECGLDVMDLGMVPTPLLYFAVFHFGLGGGVEVTGSHNPPEFNGFKMMIGEGTIHGEAIQQLRVMIESGDFDIADKPGVVTSVDVLTPYLNYIKEDITLGDWPSGRALKVVIDAGNGIAGIAAEPVLKALGLDVIAMFTEPDGNFPNHHPDPSEEENLEALREAVAEHGADLGVAYDGDGDRIGVIAEDGSVIWGDKLMILFSRALLEEVPGATIVGEVKCSQAMYDDIAAKGGNGIMWKVGHSLIKSKMKESGALLAGEMSGHIFFKHRYFGFDDAIYSTARLVEIITRTAGPVSGMLSDVPETFATPEIRLETPDKTKFAVAQRVAESFTDEEVITIDGVRVVFSDGWGLIRASNTQPALVLRAEAHSPGRCAEIEAMLRARIAEAEAQVSA